MVDLLSFLMGSTFTLFAYQTYRIFVRSVSYLTPSSKMPLLSNNWVIVGGSTDGIGREYVNYLAQQKCKVIALGRNMKKLQELKASYQQIQVVNIDFSEESFNDSSLEKIQKVIQKTIKEGNSQEESKVVGFINSVGVSHFSPYNSLTNAEITKIHNTNVGSLNFMLQLSNQLLKNKSVLEQSPFFINISSAVAQEPHKYSIVYAATKAYLSNLIQGSSKENKKVTFLDVRPWYVKTKMVSYQNSWDSVEPRQVVEGSFRNLGKRAFCSGTLKHQMIDEFSWLLKDHFQKRIEEMMERYQKIKSLRKKRKQ